jgi:hypothetical protein
MRYAELPARGFDGVRFGGARRLKTKDRFAFFHEIETIARDRFQISRVGLEQIYLASLMRKQTLLLVYLYLQVVDLGPALHQFFVGRNEQAHDHQPDCEDEQDAKNSIESLPNCGLATRAEISVRLIHSTHHTAVDGFVTKFLLDPQELIVFRNAIAAAKRARLDLAGVGRNRDVCDGCVFRFARAMTDHGGVIVFLCQINRRQGFGERADLINFD